MATKTSKTPKAKRQEFDLPALIERFGSEDRCREYLEGLRWPNGTECPRCESKKVSRIETRQQFDCSSCGYQFSVRVGTVFHDSHLPLWKWFLAVYLICESKKGISANQLKRTLGVAYKTAWYLCHRIRSAMTQDGSTPLRGIVEADETYLGGKRTFGKGREQQWGKDWREGKAVVIGALERDGQLRLRHVPNARKTHVHKFIRDVVAPDAEALYTDSFKSYDAAVKGTTRHESVNHSDEEWVRGEVHTNGIESAWSLFDRAVIGAYHKLSHKHLPAYLDEFTFRFNNRENPFLFRDTILRLIDGETLPYSALTQGEHP